MIVRILTEGQFDLPGSFFDDLNALDNKLVEVVEIADKDQFSISLKEMLDLVRENGKPVPIDEFVESDVVLPAPAITIDDCRRALQVTTAIYESAMTQQPVDLPLAKDDPFYSNLPPDGFKLPSS